MNRQTVRHAIDILEQEGVIRRDRGSGIYINNSRFANLPRRMRVVVVTTYVDGYIFRGRFRGIESVLFINSYYRGIEIPHVPIND